MRDEEVMHAMNLDDAYRVECVLASGAGGVTELVTLGGAGPFVRKKVPAALANQGVWAAIASLDCARVPRVQATYSLPDVFVVIYDYVPGQTLQELVLASGRLNAAKAASLAMEICEAASRGSDGRESAAFNLCPATAASVRGAMNGGLAPGAFGASSSLRIHRRPCAQPCSSRGARGRSHAGRRRTPAQGRHW